MSEDSSAPTPQVFVVDSQASYLSMPKKKSTWARVVQKFLPPLLTLFALAVVVEGYLIYILYQRTEALSGCVSNNLCHNVSHPGTSDQQDGKTSRRIGTQGWNESNEIPSLQPQKRPFVHLMGVEKSNSNIVQWRSPAHDDRRRMEYRNSRLIINQEGYYYVYSKLVVDVSEATSPIVHTIMSKPSGYGSLVEFLKSKSNWGPKKSSDSSENRGTSSEDKWRSFLSGIFLLQDGDEIYVTLSNMDKLSLEANENCLGAIWIDT
ncbi:tumor necrosis factor ligand superfamily member 6-like isoform X1 [Poecilia latipinna]|uniref:tumor necrosis factor ligand superfamily member 6-like isoform X1 n=1 Tax=Poecilia latipinna TaxID=48699 RepID=UPI00072DF69C|nr:PREDICTED: tumor necrosis factor ligand superfamily member 6-like isoform X1 [Poecilia latipinna]